MAEKPEDSSTVEIEITPEMIEAGVRVLAGYNPKFDLEEDAAEEIYRAMFRAKFLEVSAAPVHQWRAPQLEGALRSLGMLECNGLSETLFHRGDQIDRPR